MRAVFRWLSATFAGCHHYDFELIAGGVSGDLAYTVGFERYRAATAEGGTVDNTLRVTHVYRLEDGDWKIVHVHGDHAPTDQSAPA